MMTQTARRNSLLAAILVGFAFSAILATQSACASGEIHVLQQQVATIDTKNGPVVFHLEFAYSSAEQEDGLMNRTSLAKDAGMLFVFDEVAKRDFWMKDTLIPLDMLFIDEDGTINHIHHMAKPLDRTLITSDRPVKAVLEINGGLADILGIQEGDKIIHPVFRNQLAQ